MSELINQDYKQIVETIMSDKFDMIDLVEDGNIDYELRERAGKVVQPLNYQKRVKILITDLPETIVNSIEEYGHETPGLKGHIYRLPHEVYDLRKYMKDIYSLLPIETKDKFYDLNKFKNKAYDLLPFQTHYKEEDIELAYTNYFERIFKALVRSSQEFEHRLFKEKLDQADLNKMYV